MTVLRMELVVTGPDLAAADLQGIAQRARDAKPAMQTILGQLTATERRLYETEGGSGGEHWPEDKPQTVDRKRRDQRPLDLRTERATGALEKSLTERNYGKNRIRRASKQQLTFGTRLFYSVFQTERPLMQFTMDDQATWEATLVEWLMTGQTSLPT